MGSERRAHEGTLCRATRSVHRTCRVAGGQCLRRASTSPLASVLEQVEVRHSALLTSFLEAVDPILDSWERVLAARGRVVRRS